MKNYKDLTDKEKKKALSKITKEVNKEQREVMTNKDTYLIKGEL